MPRSTRKLLRFIVPARAAERACDVLVITPLAPGLAQHGILAEQAGIGRQSGQGMEELRSTVLPLGVPRDRKRKGRDPAMGISPGTLSRKAYAVSEDRRVLGPSECRVPTFHSVASAARAQDRRRWVAPRPSEQSVRRSPGRSDSQRVTRAAGKICKSVAAAFGQQQLRTVTRPRPVHFVSLHRSHRSTHHQCGQGRYTQYRFHGVILHRCVTH